MDWPALTLGLVIEKTVEPKTGGQPVTTVHFGISSLPKDTQPQKLLEHFRKHWGIENGVHYPLDVSMGEDACRVRAGSGAGILSALRKMALGLMRRLSGGKTVPACMRSLRSSRAVIDALRQN